MATDSNIETIKGADKKWLEERRKRICHLINKTYDQISDGRILDVGMGKWSLIKTHFQNYLL